MAETVQASQQDGHFNESIVNEEILEDMKKNRIDHMKYLPDMEQLEESDVMDQVISTMNAYDYDKYTEADVRRALAHDNRTPEDFKALLSPAALPLLEEIAQAARIETRKHFGNSICMFTPIYIANYCENYCIYCGFNCHNKIRRAQLNADEIEKEMAAIAETGYHAYLLQRKYPHAEIAFSCPRLRPIINNDRINPKDVHEPQLLQVVCAYRLFMPFASITVSTRECERVRDNLVNIAATKISAGVSTGIGSHVDDIEDKGDDQFEISDGRSVDEVFNALKDHGLQPVMNDYIYL